MPRLAFTGGNLTPKQLHELANVAEALEVETVDLVPQISETKGNWFRLDGDAIKAGRVVFEKERGDG